MSVLPNSSELWKGIPGYECFYEASDQGRIRSLDRPSKNKYGPGRRGRILQGRRDKDGYLCVSLSVDGDTRYFKIHRLVASSFISPVAGKHFVNHINLDKTDNRVVNLEWCTCRENSKHGFERGVIKVLWACGESHPNAKLSSLDVADILKLASSGVSGRELSNVFGVSRATISLILNGKRWVQRCD